MRWLLLVWGGALAAASLCIASIARTPLRDPLKGLSLPKAPVVAIGSSLTAFGIAPEDDGRNSLLGDGRAHVRLASARLEEREAIALVRLAVAGGAESVIV